MKFLALLIIVIPTISFSEIFRADQHCVAWKAKERFLLFFPTEAIGMNCAIETEFVKNEDGISFHGTVNVHKFKSDQTLRDDYVADHLGGETADLSFRSTAAPPQLWWQIIKLERGILPGKLMVNGHLVKLDMPVSISKSGDIIILSGTIKTYFSFLGIEKPSFLWGLLINVDDAIELHYRIRLDKTKNSHYILSKPKGEVKSGS